MWDRGELRVETVACPGSGVWFTRVGKLFRLRDWLLKLPRKPLLIVMEDFTARPPVRYSHVSGAKTTGFTYALMWEVAPTIIVPAQVWKPAAKRRFGDFTHKSAARQHETDALMLLRITRKLIKEKWS